MTLGCKVNQYETQAIERILCEYGHKLVDLGDGCDVCILNTCAVTAESVRKSRQAIRRMKKLEPNALIAVCGCYSHLEPEEVADLGVDLIGGAMDRREFALMVSEPCSRAFTGQGDGSSVPESGQGDGSSVPESGQGDGSSVPEPPLKRECRLKKASGFKTRQMNRPPVLLSFEELPPGNTASRTRALLKIQDGCNNFCSYCIVPYIRGRSRSLPLTKVAEYAKLLEEQGYKEIVITGIEVSSYGIDLKKQGNGSIRATGSNPCEGCTTDGESVSVLNNNQLSTFNFQLSTFQPHPPSLLTAIQTIQTAAPSTRLRLGSLNPSLMTSDFCRELSKMPNLCNHFHLSLQSGCDETLHRMGRKYNTSQVLESIESIKKHFNDCSITADLITGFPGETKEEFKQALNFIKKAAFADMHIFPYSLRPGTKAAKLPNQVEKNVRKERAKAAIEIAAEMTNDFKQKQLGKTVEVLFEQEKTGYSTGHSTNYLEIYVKENIKRNSIQNVRITDLQNGRLYGEIISTPTPF